MASTFEVSEEDWISGVNELGSQEDIFFRIRWSFGHVLGIAAQLRVNNRKIRLLLRQPTREDSLTTYLVLSLPDRGFGMYEKRTDVVGPKQIFLFSLTILMEPGSHEAGIGGEIYITNGLSFVIGEGSENLLQ